MNNMDLPAVLEEKRRQAEAVIGKPIFIRQVKTQDPNFRGRIKEHSGNIVIEYQIAQAGFFWDTDLIERLLFYVLAGKTDFVLREE